MTTLVPEHEPAELYEPVRYVLQGQGKRLRPLLLLLSAETFGAGPEEALPAALAVEVFHNFTLVHDDIMDHAAERRGRPTVHVRWDERTAILCGDLLMARAFDLLSRGPRARLADVLPVFHEMVARLCEGQALDNAFETRQNVSVAAYLDMIDRKTGALLRAALEIGAALAGADADQRATCREVGRHVGRAFQIQDDLLDLVADDERWGKAIGGDLMAGKKTYLLLRALEAGGEEDRRWFGRVGAGRGLPPDAVDEARRRMERAGVLDEARRALHAHYAAADEGLRRLPHVPAQETLRWLVYRMQARLH